MRAPGWSSRDKFAAVLETAALNEADMAEYCRKRGLFPAQITAWRSCEQANDWAPCRAQARLGKAIQGREEAGQGSGTRACARPSQPLLERCPKKGQRSRWTEGRMIRTPDRPNRPCAADQSRLLPAWCAPSQGLRRVGNHVRHPAEAPDERNGQVRPASASWSRPTLPEGGLPASEARTRCRAATPAEDFPACHQVRSCLNLARSRLYLASSRNRSF